MNRSTCPGCHGNVAPQSCLGAYSCTTPDCEVGGELVWCERGSHYCVADEPCAEHPAPVDAETEWRERMADADDDRRGQ